MELQRAPEEEEQSVVRFNYIKTSSFRDVHVDGAVGAPTPRVGFIQMAVYNERIPIPQETVFTLTPEGALGQELKEQRVSREAIVRSVEVNLIMDVMTARSLRAWLDEQIKIVEGRLNALGE